jgi:hypothetical protein
VTYRQKGRVLQGVALSVDVLPALIATLTQFPVWIEQSAEATVSGIVLVFGFLACIPLIKQIKAFIKSPSAPIMWCVLYLGLVVLRNIIDQMVVVCFVGMISNAIGTVIYKYGTALINKDEE